MGLATPLEMRVIDEETISTSYNKAIVLMEKAGKSVAEEAEGLAQKSDFISIFCGQGRNGGDGLVAARHLLKKKRKVKVFLFASKKELEGITKENLKRFLKLKGKVVEVKTKEDLKKAEEDSRASAIIIDALLGIGLKGEVKGLIAEAINLINGLKKKVISVDIPSGLDGERGLPLGSCVVASTTITFGLGKPGLFVAPGVKFCGRVKVVDIGLNPSVISKKKLSHHLLEKSDMAGLLPRRELDCHKGDNGHVLVIAGSEGFTGAACLTSLGALRSGAGLVTLGIPASLNCIVASKLTEAMTKPLPETEDLALSLKALPLILDFSKRCQAVALGPGLSRHPETGRLVLELISHLAIPMVIDADALFALKGKLEILKQAKAPIILTPHLGEMARLLGKKTSEVRNDKLNIARIFSGSYKVILVLKDARTVMASPDGHVYINPTGNPGLASGGTGDVLTGMIASLLGQGLKPLEAAKVAIYLHGLAADELSLSRGQWGMLASDIVNQLPFSLQQLSLHLCPPSSSG